MRGRTIAYLLVVGVSYKTGSRTKRGSALIMYGQDVRNLWFSIKSSIAQSGVNLVI